MKREVNELNGDKWPVLIATDEWYYKGRFIQKNTHPNLQPYTSFNDDAIGTDVQPHFSMDEAKRYCRANPCLAPLHKPLDFLK